MFASLGFTVDTSGLKTFKSSLKDARSEMTNLTRGSKNATRQLRSLRSELTKVSTKMSALRGAGGGTSTANYHKIANAVGRLNKEFGVVVRNRRDVTEAIGRISSSVVAGTRIWDNYRASVVRARRSLANINGQMRHLRNNANVNVRVNQGGGGTGGGGGVGRGLGAGVGAGMGLGGLMSARHFLGSFLPAASIMSAASASGYLAMGAVKQGREQTKMETMLMMTANNTKEFGDSLKYVRDEAMRLGLSSVELGKSFAQINMSARALSHEQKKEMFTGFSEFMVAMGTDKDDQKGIFRAFNQMFGAGRILQEEINQLTERGIPATLVMDAAKQAYGTDSVSKIKKLQEDGQLDPNKVLPVMAKMVQQLANDSGALEKMQRSSLYKQQQFMEALSQFSQRLMDSGLDEWLGSMFGKMTELVGVMDELLVGVKGVAEVFRALKGVTDTLTGGNSWFIAVLAVVILRFRHIVRLTGIIFRLFRSQASITRILSTIMTGTFGKALGSVIGKFFIWIAAITAVIKGLRFVYKQIKKRESGELNWIDITIWKIEELGLWFELLGVKIEWAWLFFKNFMKDVAKVDLGALGELDLLGTNLRTNGMYDPNANKGVPYKTPDGWNGTSGTGNWKEEESILDKAMKLFSSNKTPEKVEFTVKSEFPIRTSISGTA